MSDSQFIIPGYVYDKPRIDDIFAERLARGDLVFGSQQPGIAGEWQRLKSQGVTFWSLRSSEVVLLGRNRRPFLQRGPTSVSRGLTRAAQCSLDYAIAKMGAVMEAAELSFASVYSIARVEIGKNSLGSQGGAILAYAAKMIHDYGIATSDLFKGLTEDQVEQLAMKYAMPGQHTPATWIAAGKGHTAKTFSPETLDLWFDSIAAGYGTSYAAQNITGLPNKNGVSQFGSYGPHCRAACGIFVDPNGVDRLIGSESWGRYPAEAHPQDCDQTMDVTKMPCVTVQTADGPVKLAPGDVGLDAEQFFNGCQSGGEIWSIGVADFSGDSIADVTAPATAA